LISDAPAAAVVAFINSRECCVSASLPMCTCLAVVWETQTPYHCSPMVPSGVAGC
jgi:hypothetical protein